MEAASSVERDSAGKTTVVFEFAAEVQELGLTVRRHVGPWSRTWWKRASGGAFPSASWRRPSISQCLVVKTGSLCSRENDTTNVDVAAVDLKHSASTPSELAVSSGRAGSSRPREEDTISADVTAAAQSAAEARPPGIAKHNALTKSELAKLFGDHGSSWSRTNGTANAAASTAAKSVVENRPPRFAKYSATSESEPAKSSDEAGFSWTRAYGTTADTDAVAKSVGEARSPSFVKHSCHDRVRARRVFR